MEEQTPQTAAPQPVDSYTPPDWNIQTRVDADGIQATSGTLLSKKLLNTYLVLGILLIVLGVAMAFFPDDLFSSIISVLGGIFVLVARSYIPRRVAKLQIRRMEETYHTDSIPFNLICWPQGLVLTNQLSHAQVNLRYEMFRRICVVGDYMVFITSARQSVLINLNSVENRGHFVDYIKAKCPNAKWSIRES